MIAWLVTLALWLVGFLIFWKLPLLRGSASAANFPSLSLIIPARNEQQNLPVLLRSLSTQPVTPREVIVVNDGSTDGTAAVARELGATVIDSAPLPDGWRGKPWACHQGAAAASGDCFLFLDADTWFEQDGLRKILHVFSSAQGALSVVPFHAVERPYEQLSAFFNLVMTIGVGAFTVLGPALKKRGLFGQMLLVERSAYFRVNGHEAVKGRTLENFALAAHFRAAGVPLRCYGGKGALAFRMYPNGLKELMQGWAKGFASGASGTDRSLLLLTVAWMCGMFSAVHLLVLHANGPAVCLYLLFAAQLAVMFRRVGAFGWATALLYPFPLVFFVGVFAWSVVQRRGGQVHWKGRAIHAD